MPRAVVVAMGFAAAALFPISGVLRELQLYGDGAFFAYSIAVEDAWRFHWYNIPGRMTAYALCYLPPLAVLRLGGEIELAVTLYGALFFGMPLAGLIATALADRSPRGKMLCYAASSTAVVAPLLYGGPSEVWISHALFWPTLALAHFQGPTVRGTLLVLGSYLLLVLTHEGAFAFAAVISISLILRRNDWFPVYRGLGALALTAAVLAGVKSYFPVDPWMSVALTRNATNFVDAVNFFAVTPILLTISLSTVGACFLLFRLSGFSRPLFAACAVTLVGLAIYWIGFDDELVTKQRYVSRSLVIVVTSGLAWVATLASFSEQDSWPKLPLLDWKLIAAQFRDVGGLAVGAVSIGVLIHGVETAKFIAAWDAYKAAIRTASEDLQAAPAFGQEAFVSTESIADLHRTMG